jgi:hypothetical protein
MIMMDPALKQYHGDLKACGRKTLHKLRWHIFLLKLDEALPELGPITTVITLGEILLWFCYPPELQSAWTTLAVLWASAMLVCIAIISIPRSRTLSYKAHWLSGD